jgi:hypothetical protein
MIARSRGPNGRGSRGSRGHGELADVVQHGDELDLDDLERVEAHALGHALGQAREAMAVVGGGLMMEAQLVGQALDRTTYPGRL